VWCTHLVSCARRYNSPARQPLKFKQLTLRPSLLDICWNIQKKIPSLLIFAATTTIICHPITPSYVISQSSFFFFFFFFFFFLLNRFKFNHKPDTFFPCYCFFFFLLLYYTSTTSNSGLLYWLVLSLLPFGCVAQFLCCLGFIRTCWFTFLVIV
jgi:hypothetical protein